MSNFLKQIKTKDLLISLTIAIVPIIFYVRLFAGFFQQDEWFGYGWFILHKDLGVLQSLAFFFTPTIGHYNPLTIGLNQILFMIWGMNYTGFLIISLIMHFSITVAVYYLSKIIFDRNKTLMILSTLLFGIFASPYQATGWVIANIATQFSTLLGIISTIFFFKFTQNKDTSAFIYSIVLIIVSLLFKEITIGLFPVFCVIYFLWSTKKERKLKYPMIILAIGLTYFVIRGLMVFAPNTTGDQLVTQSITLSKLAYNFVTIPIKTISQTVIPPDLIKSISFKLAGVLPQKLTGTIGSPEFEAFAVKRVMEVLSILVGVLIVGFSLKITFAKKNNQMSRIIWLSLAWAIVNSFIYSISPGQSSVIFIIDSRNLYFSSIGVSILIVAVLWQIAKSDNKKLLLFVIPIFILNVFWLNKYLSEFAQRGNARRVIVNQITKWYVYLPEKVVFYTQSDTSYYGLPESEKILPFQSGLGQTLLSWYFKTENFPKNFFENRYLWEITDQGYKEFGGRGFGYFRNLELLKDTIKKYNLSQDSVIAFSWNSKTNTLTDITREIRDELFLKNEKVHK